MNSNNHKILVSPYSKSRKRSRPSQQQPRQQLPIPTFSTIETINGVQRTQNDRNQGGNRQTNNQRAQQTPLVASDVTKASSKPPPAPSRPTSPTLITNPYSKSRTTKQPISPNKTTNSKSQHLSTKNTTTLISPRRSISPQVTYNPYSKSNRTKPIPSTKNIATTPTILPRRKHPNVPNQKQASRASISADASALIISASDKAGMEGIDRTQIDAIILRESGDSLYIQQQKRRDAKVNERIVRLQAQKQALQAVESSTSVESQLQSWQASCPARSTKVVVDMDMFYMACELLSKPQLDQHPACVGRGMILTSNYRARQYGVRSAMAGFVADKLVEELSQGKERLIHVPSHFGLYKEKSQQVKEVLQEYDPDLKSYSLDEAYLDLGPYLALYLEHSCESGGAEMTANWGTVLSDELHSSIRDTLTGGISTTKKMEGTSGDTNGGSVPPHGKEPSGVKTTDATDEEVEDDQMEEMVDQGLDETNVYVEPKEMNMEEIKCRRRHQDYMKILNKYSVEICNQAIQTVVHQMRAQVQARTGGLTCSAGMAPHSGLAKMASDINKPNGQLLVDPHKVLEFLHPLAVRKVPGIGRVTQKILQHVLQVETVQQLYQQRAWIPKLFQKASANYLLKAAVGHIGTGCSSASNGNSFHSFGTNDEVEEDNDHQKGMSRERTFRPESNYQTLQSKLESIAEILSNDMMRKKVKAHTVTVKVKLFTFDVFSRAKSLDRNVYVQDAQELKVIAKQLLASIKAELASKRLKDAKKKEKEDRDENNHEEGHELCCRLLGIRCSSLMHQDALPQQKPMDKFLTRINKASAIGASTKKEQGPPTGSETIPMPSKEIEISISSNTQSGKRVIQEESNTCPLCNAIIIGDNDVLNRHIDTCLNASTVRQVVKEVTKCTQEEAMPTDSSKEKASQSKKLTDFW